MKYFIRRVIFWGLSPILLVFMYALLVNGPELLQDYTFQAGPRLIDGTPVQGISQIIPDDAKAVILIYFSTDCQYCAQHMRAMNSLHKQPIFVIGFNVGGSQKAVEKFVQKNNITFPIILGIRQDQALDYTGNPLQGFPYTFLSTETGYTAWYGVGLPDDAVALLEALNEE